MLTFSINRGFTDLAETSMLTRSSLPRTDKGREWLSEACLNAINQISVIGMNSEKGQAQKVQKYKLAQFKNLDVDRYAVGCELNLNRTISNREIPIVSADEVEQGVYGVSESVAVFVETGIDEILDSSEVKTLVNEFVLRHDEIMVKKGLDLWEVLESAKRADVKMINKLRDLVTEFNMAHLIEGILTNTDCMRNLRLLFSSEGQYC